MGGAGMGYALPWCLRQGWKWWHACLTGKAVCPDHKVAR